ncbi:MAG: DUF4173 domain-containing protein [Ignavibacteria bacterium]|nr:DUF4173 domain-containing protein [Ignavibacteria bacterium]
MHKPRFLITIALLVTYNFFFWSEKLGANLFIFFTLGIIAMLFMNEENIKNKNVIVSMLISLYASAMVVFVNSGYAKFAAFVCFMIFTGYIHQPQLQTVYNAVLTTFSSFLIFPYNIYIELKYFASKFRAFKLVLKFAKLAFIPVIFFVIFYAIYAYSNPVFNSYSVTFWDSIGKYLYDIFINYPILRFFYILLGLMLITAFIYNNKIRVFTELDNSFHETLQRDKIFKVHSRTRPIPKTHLMYTMFSYRFKPNSLKLETKMGIVLLVMMNALLVLLNIIDVQVTWLGFDATNIENLAYYVHEGTYYLIFSILLSMAILLVIFRGSQNYLASNKTLKLLAYTWIVQNAFMAVSVSLRNIYYIDYYYALSFKRIGVMIFILLTLTGLASMLYKIYAKKTTFWLFKFNSFAAVIMLLVMSSFSWDVTIAEFNLKNPAKDKIDIDYLLKLNNDALPVLDKHRDVLDRDFLEYSFIFSDYRNGLEVYKARVENFDIEQENYSWLSWNLPDERTKQYYKESGSQIYLPLKKKKLDSLKNNINEKNEHLEIVPRRDNHNEINAREVRENEPKTEEVPKLNAGPEKETQPEKDKNPEQR